MTEHTRRARAVRMTLAAVALAITGVAVACKKDATAPVMVAASNATLPMNSTITTALAGTSFSFPGGAGALASEVANQNLTLGFAGTSSAPTASASITNSAGAVVGTFSANVTFGSCIFVVSVSTFPTGSRLAVGNTIVVNPCNLNANTAGMQATGVSATRSVSLVLGAAASSGSSVTLSVNPGGQLTLNGASVGTVTLVPVSG